VTPPEPASDEPPDEEWLDESLLEKLDRDDQCEPLPLDELLLQLVFVCAGAVAPGTVAPGGVGSQFRRGISMKAVVPTAIVPMTSSATWPERFTGSLGTGG
jgi:hypothetical protein